MSYVKVPHVVPLFVLSLLLCAFGCAGLPAGNAPPPASPQPSTGTLSVSPKQAVLTAGNSLQFTASATGNTNGGLNWMVDGVLGGNAASGTISASGLYAAPQSVTANTQAGVAVASKTNPILVSSAAAITVVPEPVLIKVSVSPSGASLHPSQTQQFTAAVTGTAYHAVSWLVNGNVGGNASVGAISSTGVYTAPPSVPAAPSVSIAARSAYDTDSSATAAVTIVAAPPSATPPPAPPPDPTPPPATNALWNPSVLGVPWASDFTTIAANEINVRTDAHLKPPAKGDGVTDDTSAIRAAILLASSSGGGVVYFPAGKYKITASSNSTRGNPLVVPSRVILRGNSSTTSLLYVNDPSAASETDWIQTWGGIDFEGASLSGMTDLGVYAVNLSASPPALLWNRGSSKVSELFFNNLDVQLNVAKSFWFEATDRLLVQNSHFDSSSPNWGPIYVVNNSHVSFLGNKITYNFSRVHLQNNVNLVMQGNTLLRDAEDKDMQEGTAIESGGVELSFGQNLQILNNTIQTLNAPPGEANDGEAIMTQQATTEDVLDAGSVTAITSTSLSDTNALWGPVTASRLAQFPEVVAILTGSAAGEWRAIKGLNTNTKTLTLDQPWKPVPEVGTLYSVFAWTLMDANIQGNTLIDNPNGIVLWDGCYDCTVQNNKLTNSRGIILRTVDESLNPALYPEGRREHEVAIKSQLLNNTVSNTSGLRPAYIVLDTEAFDKKNYHGIGLMNIQVAGNVIEPYSANPDQTYGPAEIPQEGFFPCFLFGPAQIKDPVRTVFQNINFWGNSQSMSVTYGSYFASYATTHACVTASAPSAVSTP